MKGNGNTLTKAQRKKHKRAVMNNGGRQWVATMHIKLSAPRLLS
jgi:hypothetical protein